MKQIEKKSQADRFKPKCNNNHIKSQWSKHPSLKGRVRLDNNLKKDPTICCLEKSFGKQK